jgi:hypothetical protein
VASVDPSHAALAAALVLAAIALLLVVRGREGGHAAAVVASWTRTPGVLNPEVTQASIHTTICVSGYSRSVRPPSDYTSRLKVEQMHPYGLAGDPSRYQEDHLISLELGGNPTDPRNLWPEPYPRAGEVDQLENELHRRVCDGSMSLADAQAEESRVKHTEG